MEQLIKSRWCPYCGLFCVSSPALLSAQRQLAPFWGLHGNGSCLFIWMTKGHAKSKKPLKMSGCVLDTPLTTSFSLLEKTCGPFYEFSTAQERGLDGSGLWTHS